MKIGACSNTLATVFCNHAITNNLYHYSRNLVKFFEFQLKASINYFLLSRDVIFGP